MKRPTSADRISVTVTVRRRTGMPRTEMNTILRIIMKARKRWKEGKRRKAKRREKRRKLSLVIPKLGLPNTFEIYKSMINSSSFFFTLTIL